MGGNCRTVMIANISPSNACYEDTHNTLKYANRAKNIKTNVQRNVLNVEYHVSKYTQIITQLKGEISDLKLQLKNGGGGSIVSVPREPQFNAAELERLKEDLNNHFAEEIKAKKRIHELEQKMESSALSIISKKNELVQLLREKGKDSIQVKIINEEVEETNNQISEMKKHLDATQSRVTSLLKRREQFPNEWKSAGIRELGVEILQHIMRENTILVENLEFSRKEQKADLQLKVKENQLVKMHEQIRIRDEMLSQARRKFKIEGVDFDIEDPRLVQLDELVHQGSLFPPIQSATYGKATSHLIKSLLNNFDRNQPSQQQQPSRRQANGIYHSLPPIGPVREQSESRIPRPKYVLQNDSERNRANINFKDIKETSQPIKKNQQSVNARSNNYGLKNNEVQHQSNKNLFQPFN